MHLRNGGIIPDIAQDLHRMHIEPTVARTLEQAKLSMEDISAIAVTLKPGLPLSLVIGMKYAKHLGRRFKKPIIPIHHMQAHALVARMHHDIKFPFLVLLISGGHCLLAVVQDVDHFQLLGESMDCAPGEVFDKVARSMKLRNVPEYSQICGGQAVEAAAAKATNPNMFKIALPLAEYKDCNFSFNGLKTSVMYHLYKKEQEHKIVAHELIPEVNDLCAAMLMATTRHLIHRTQRAMEFCKDNNLIPEDSKQLVVSGGVAYNGVMIAWNGLEKWRKGLDITTDFSTLDIEATSPIGESLIDKVKEAKISTKLIKIKASN
uniref:N(6)-L-threonylcarbamoyladenine synthase n=1 Tax=Spodoptera frugiperda TaxID=7108 RepID=A0A2H1X3N5_SPOFR